MFTQKIMTWLSKVHKIQALRQCTEGLEDKQAVMRRIILKQFKAVKEISQLKSCGFRGIGTMGGIFTDRGTEFLT